MALNIAQMQAGVPSAFDQAIGGFQIGTKMRQHREAERQAKLQAEQQAARQQQVQAALGGFYGKLADGTATSADLTQMMVQAPEFKDQILKGFEMYNEEEKQDVLGQTFAIANAIATGDTDVASKTFDNYIAAAENDGDQNFAAVLKQGKEMLKTDPTAALTSIISTVAAVDEDKAKVLLDVYKNRLNPEGRDLQLKPVQLKDGSQAFVAWDEQANEFFEPGTDRRYAPGEVTPVPARELVRVGGEDDFGNIPPGWQLTRDESGAVTGMAPIPGSPAELEMKQEEAKKAEGVKWANKYGRIAMQDIARAAKKVKDNPISTTGLIGVTMSKIPGTVANDVKELIDTVKSNVAFTRLQNMRDASPTGGALGQVSDTENKMMAQAMGALGQGQTFGQQMQNLVRALDAYQDIVHGTGNRPEGDLIDKFGLREFAQFEDDFVEGGGYSEGQTATNPQTGEKLVFRNGEWSPVQ